MFRRLRPDSLRSRLTAIATGVVAVVLGATALALVVIQARQLESNLDASLEQRADIIAADLGPEIPDTAETVDDDRAIQVVDGQGTVIVSSSNLVGQPPLAISLSAGVEQSIETRSDLPLEDDAYRVLTRRVDTAAGPGVLHVAENIDDLDETLAGLVATLLVTVPLVVIVLALLMWWLIGRTLGPVDSIRSDVDAISAGRLGQRVHVPATDDEITRLAHTMNRMLDRLDDASARQRRFVADAAHELRTPLARIRTDIEVDLAHPAQADQNSTIEAVRDELVGLESLIDDLLHLARSDSGHLAAKLRPLDLDDIVFGELRRQPGTNIVIDASGVSAAPVNGDRDQLARTVRNLLSNAVRHARSHVTITLREIVTSEIGESVELTVSDDGPGVPPHERDRIFDRFTRVDDARSRGDGGTGLGLAIAKDIVERHGGTIACEQSAAGGAQFRLTLPGLK